MAHPFVLSYASRVDGRFDIIDVADKEYEIRDGTGVGVGASQFGARRASSGD